VSPAAGESQAAALLAILELEERKPDVFVGQTPSTERQRIFGGQVAGQALMAAERTAPAERAVHSLHSYFLRPGDPHEEIRYEVDRIRDGRSFTTRRVVAWQQRKGEDVAIFALTADFHAGERAVAEHSLPMPDVPAPDSVPGTAEIVARHGEKAAWMAAMGRAVEQRFLEDPFAAPPKSPPCTRPR
jgi:acyl-CoA thioesterase II